MPRRIRVLAPGMRGYDPLRHEVAWRRSTDGPNPRPVGLPRASRPAAASARGS